MRDLLTRWDWFRGEGDAAFMSDSTWALALVALVCAVLVVVLL